jgi:hypothetical protein
MGFFDKLLGGGKKTPFTSSAGSLIEKQDEFNRYNIYTPTGSRYFGTDDEGRSTLTIEETPFQQSQRAKREALASTFLDSLAGGDDRFAAESKRIGDVTFERALSRLEPTLEKNRRASEVALANQGRPVGSEIRSDLIAERQRGENDLYSALAMDAELAAGQEQSRLRGLALAEASAFAPELSGIDNSFFGSGIANIDAAGITNAAESLMLDRYAQEAVRQNTQRSNFIDLAQGGISGAKSINESGGLSSFFGGGGSGGGSSTASNIGTAITLASMFSDRRVKENIKLLGKKNGFDWYEFNYKGKQGTYRGVMAQDVEKIKPEAVTEINGVKAVNYAMIGLEMEAV